MISISEEFLSGVLGTTVEEITNSLKDGENLKPQEEVEAYIKSSLDDSVSKLRHKFKKEGYTWGAQESLTKKEKELKEKFGVEGDTIDDIVDNLLEGATKKAALNPDDVKNSEVFINETKRLKDIIKEKETELSNKESTFAKAETMRQAKELGLRYLKEKNFVLPEDEDIKDEALSNLFTKLEDDQTKLSISDGKVIVLDANGRPKENEQGTKEITFEDLFGVKAKRYFKQAVADDRKSPANKNEGGKGNNNPDMPDLKSTEDFYKAIDEASKDPAKIKALKVHYEKLVEDGVIKD